MRRVSAWWMTRAKLWRVLQLYFLAAAVCYAAVTGTNGKTSVTTFCRQIWMQMGLEAVNLGTTGVEGVLERTPETHDA